MSRRITIIGLCLSGNKGGPAIVSGLAHCLRALRPDLTIQLLSPNPKEDQILGAHYGVEVAERPRKGGLWKFFLLLRGTDLVIDMHGVKFCGRYSLANNLNDALPILIPKLMGIPVVCFTQTYGPFENRLTQFFAKFSLKLADRVMARDQGSLNSLNQLYLREEPRKFPDIAFQMPADNFGNVRLVEKTQRFLERYPKWIGIGLSTKIISEPGGENYENVMIDFANSLLFKGFKLFFIPHTYAPSIDDLLLSKRVAQTLHREYQDCVALLDQDLSPQQLKAIIGRAHLFVGSRYHAILAALSMGVPTLSVGWNHKYDGLLDLFGMEKFALKARTLRLENLEEAFQTMLNNREILSSRLTAVMPQILQKTAHSVSYALGGFLDER